MSKPISGIDIGHVFEGAICTPARNNTGNRLLVEHSGQNLWKFKEVCEIIYKSGKALGRDT